MYRHLKHRYGMQICRLYANFEFDFSWAFALVRRTKENVLSCLQSVIADLNTLTGGSKPPVTRVHSDQAKEFPSRPVMEWLKEKGNT